MRLALLVWSALALVGCGSGPTRLRLVDQSQERCRRVTLDAWKAVSHPEPLADPAHYAFRPAWRKGAGGEILVAGESRRLDADESTGFSDNQFRVVLETGGVFPATDEQWNSGKPLSLWKQEGPTLPPVEGEHRDLQWTRVSPKGDSVLTMSHSLQPGWFRPVGKVYYELFPLPLGKPSWRAEGVSPWQPPDREFALSGWIDERWFLLIEDFTGRAFYVCSLR
ncbi:MAG: hypothetical protein SFV54_29090 [Bryobacteraceae bacterium]|nr:hypothetical protein [Bryobacteraceae bacterium]